MLKKAFILLFVVLFAVSVGSPELFAGNSDNEFNNRTSAGNTGPGEDYRLFQNFPNPFNPATILSYKLNRDGFVSLSVFNLVGQEVATLVSEYQEAGTYTRQFDASNLAAGVYLYKLQVNGYTSVKRMTLIK